MEASENCVSEHEDRTEMLFSMAITAGATIM